MNSGPIMFTDFNPFQIMELILFGQLLIAGLLTLILVVSLINIVVTGWSRTPPPPPVDYRLRRR